MIEEVSFQESIPKSSDPWQEDDRLESTCQFNIKKMRMPPPLMYMTEWVVAGNF